MTADESNDDRTQTHVVLTKGTMVSHYRIVEKIGAGGMGEVYLAEDTKLKRKVALKFLPSHLCQEDDCRRRFTREAQAVAKLSHPNVVTIYDVSEFQRRPFFGMEYVEGKSLKDYASPKELSIEHILELGIQICEGLQDAHGKGVTHRDIKPSNILIDSHGRARIVDFGLASVVGVDQLTKTGSTLGTIGYMSPEQVQGKDVDHRSDLFSLGVVLYEMITKQNPFKRDSEAATLKAVSDDLLEPLARYKSGLPEGLQGIIDKALEKDIRTRYQHADGMLSDLVRVKRSLESGRSTVSGHLVSKHALQRWWPAALIVVVVASMLIVTKPWQRDTISDESDKIKLAVLPSIAVLPFVDMSPNKDQEYFCDGIAEELINGLAQLGGLKVAARTSAFQFKQPDRNIPAIGRELGVTAVLEGSVRKAGNRLRITAQLISVKDGFHLWSEKYDRTLDDIFAIQDEISLAIVEKLRLQLLEPEKKRLVRRHTDNKEAYNLYLKGRYFWNKRHEGGMTSALDYYQQAIDKDPTYPLPYIGIADAYVILGTFGFLPPRESFPKAKAAANKALELDSNLGEAHAPLAFAAFFYDWDWNAAEREFDTCFELTPNYAIAHSWYATYLSGRGRYEEALAEAERALELDPLSLVFSSVVGLMHLEGHNFEQAIEQLKQTLERDSTFQLALLWLSYSYYGQGNLDDALATTNKLESLPGGEKYAAGMLGAIYAHQGRVEETESELKRLKTRAENEYVPSIQFALMLIPLGRKDEAVEYLEKAYEERDGYLTRLTVSPIFGEDMQTHPRCIELARRLGLDI